jgi:hypothetical protein
VNRVRNTWHRPRDWENIDPESVKLPQTPELFAHDATAVAIERFPEAAAKVCVPALLLQDTNVK